jgi:general secretion pathway protein G
MNTLIEETPEAPAPVLPGTPNASRSDKELFRLRTAVAARGTRGMTLIEILVVLAIIGLIMGGVAVAAFSRLSGAQADQAKNDVLEIENLSEMYMLQKSGKCPKSMKDLKAAGITKKVKKDPWGTEYKITCPAQHSDSVDVSSAGKDKQFGNEDDVNSWDDASGEAAEAEDQG